MKRPVVLIIEDDPQVAHVTRFILKRSGFEAIAAGTAEEGLHLAFEIQPDVVLCDAALPRISGPEVLRILKMDATTTHIPVIMMSGNEGIDCPGIFTFLAKPFDSATLVGATRNALADWKECQLVEF
jgi:twitching motility two-component system response regulator PilG